MVITAAAEQVAGSSAEGEGGMARPPIGREERFGASVAATAAAMVAAAAAVGARNPADRVGAEAGVPVEHRGEVAGVELHTGALLTHLRLCW